MKSDKRNPFTFAASVCAFALLAPIASAQAQTNNTNPGGDLDNDGVKNIDDNCLNVPNPEQRDLNKNGFGDLCDADLNGDGIVNAIDLGIFENQKIAQDKRDLNGDGRLDKADLAILKRRFLKRPGPSLFAPDRELEKAPPKPVKVEYKRLRKPGPNGENVVVTAEFIDTRGGVEMRRRGGTVSLRQDTVIQFNDLGVSPDGVANDGVFTGFSKLDFSSLQQANAKFQARAAKRKPEPLFFSGRSVVDEAQAQASLQAQARLFVANTSNTDAVDPNLEPEDVNLEVLTPGPLASSSNPDHSIAINDPSVVANPTMTFDPCDTDGTGNNVNPDAPWSFKTLMANMAVGSGLSTQEFVHQWLRTWVEDQTANGFTVTSQQGVDEFFPGWDRNDSSTLDLDKLPYRLLAVMNRIDLTKRSYTGFEGSTGEIRLVFGLVQIDDDPLLCRPTPFREAQTVIFEYGDPAGSCSDVKARANQWIELSDEPLGSASYLAKLKAITDVVTTANSNPTKPNGNAINQLRVNDFAFDPDDSTNDGFWELREYRLSGATSPLVLDPLDQTPDAAFRFNSPTTAQYIKDNWLTIGCRQYEVPLSYSGQNFLAGSIKYSPNTSWIVNLEENGPQPPVIPDFLPCGDTASFVDPSITPGDLSRSELRHTLSLNACDDCHSRETDTFFVHVHPNTRNFSTFLTGNEVSDPDLGGLIKREFNDIERRAQVLEALAMRDCSAGRLLNPTEIVNETFVH